MNYTEFLDRRSRLSSSAGFEDIRLHPSMRQHQAMPTRWALERNRAAIFADCGLGKTLMLLVWAENVARITKGKVLIGAPIAVGRQIIQEADKFGIEGVCLAESDNASKFPIHVTNYEKLHRFNESDYKGVVWDESGVLKNCDGKTRTQVIEFSRKMPYRLLSTATAAPNDYPELGNSSECLGELGYYDMLTKFFKAQTGGNGLGWNRTRYLLRSHAQVGFWRWVSSWAKMFRRPSDLGFPDDGYVLPELIEEEHVVEMEPPEGKLFCLPSVYLSEQLAERRRSLNQRCGKVAELVKHGEPVVCWVSLNDEGDLLEEMIPDSVQVSGSDSDESKIEKLDGFRLGQFRVLISKPEICGFGLNWQHCSHQTFFPTHSYEQYYQAVRRSWRFGQTKPVKISLVGTEADGGILASLKRKADSAEAMLREMIAHMNNPQTIDPFTLHTKTPEVPSWLLSIN